MRRDVQEIFRNTPHGKQVMMFSATLSKEIRPVCKKFMQDVITTTSPNYNQSLSLCRLCLPLLWERAVVAAACAVAAATRALLTITMMTKIIIIPTHRITNNYTPRRAIECP